MTRDGRKIYVVSYKDLDPGCPIFTWRTRAYDPQHARENFLASCEDDGGWEIVSVARAKDGEHAT